MTTLRDLILEYGVFCYEQGQKSEQGLEEEGIEDELDTLIERIKERIVG